MGNRADVMIGVGLGAGLIYFLDPQTKSPSVLKAAREGGSRRCMSPRLQPMRRREIPYIALHNSGRASRPALGRRDSTIIDRVRAASLHLHLLRMPQ